MLSSSRVAAVIGLLLGFVLLSFEREYLVGAVTLFVIVSYVRRTQLALSAPDFFWLGLMGGFFFRALVFTAQNFGGSQ